MGNHGRCVGGIRIHGNDNDYDSIGGPAMIEKIMWYYDCTREEAEKLYDELSDSQKADIDMTHYAWTHNIDY